MTYGPKRAVDNITLTVQTGSVTAILGPNGAGKTTVVETCEGYRRPHHGQVRVLGLDPAAQHQALAPRIGVMLQGGGVWNGARAVEMLRYAASLHRTPLSVDMLVERLGLGSCGTTKYRKLSGGQQQRLGLAMALVGRPELVFLDEPTAGLDPQARRATWELVEQLRADGVTVVLTTHYMDEAERLASYVYVVDRGLVLTEGTPESLVTARANNRITFVAPRGLDTGPLRAVLPPDCQVTEDPAGCYRVEGLVNPQILAAVTVWCADLDVMPERLTVATSSLEDVFLELTGRELRS